MTTHSDLRALRERARLALIATSPEPVCDREIGVRDALRDLLFALLPDGEALDLDTHNDDGTPKHG